MAKGFDWGSALKAFSPYAMQAGVAFDDMSKEKYDRSLKEKELARQAELDAQNKKLTDLQIASILADVGKKQSEADIEKKSREAVSSVSGTLGEADKFKNFAGPPAPDALAGTGFSQSKAGALNDPLGFSLSKLAQFGDTGVVKSFMQPMLDKDKSAREAAEAAASQKRVQDFTSRENQLDRESANYRAGLAASSANENARQQQAALKAAEFGEKEKEMIGAVEEGKTLMTSLVETYKAAGFGGAKSIPGETAAKIPGIGKFVAGKNKEFQNQKRVAAETWLRAATGANAPESEVKTYTGFLPDESDPPEVAQNKMENFFNKISAKAIGRAKTFDLEGKGLEQRGMTDLANVKYTQANLIRGMIDESKAAIPSITEKKKQAGASRSFDELWGE